MTAAAAVASTDAAERIRAWNRSGNSDALWPDVPRADRLKSMALIRSVIEAALAGKPPPGLWAEHEHAARALGIAAFSAGLGPLLAHWIDTGLLDASPPARRVLAEHREQAIRRIELMRMQAVALVRAMRSAGVDPILLKGMHTGAELFPYPWTRPASDIDFLIRPPDVPHVFAVLRTSGFTETIRSRFQRRSTWRHASAPRVVHSIELDVPENPWTVDILQALERWYFRGTRRDLGSHAFDTTRAVDIEGEAIRVLDQPYLTAFLALHTSHHFRAMQLVRLLELVWVVREDLRTGRLQWGELEELLQRTATGRFVYPALALAEDLAPGTVEPALLHRLAEEVSPRMRRVLDRIRRAEMGELNERSTDILLAWAVGSRELLLNSLEVMLPSDDAIGSLPAVWAHRARVVARSLYERVRSS